MYTCMRVCVCMCVCVCVCVCVSVCACVCMCFCMQASKEESGTRKRPYVMGQEETICDGPGANVSARECD